MLRTFMTTTALGAVLATGALAQSPPAATPGDGTPLIEQRTPAGEADAAEDGAVTTEDEATAQDDEADEPLFADDDIADEPETAAEPEDGDQFMADDPAEGPAVDETDTASDAADEPVLADEPADDTAADEPMMAEDPADEPATGAPALADDPAADEPAMAEDEAVEDDVAIEEEEAEAPALDLAGAMPEDLIGTDVRDFDDERIATVDDVTTGAGNEVESIIVSFGGFLGFGQTTVALQPDEVMVERGEDGEEIVLRTALTSEELRERPAHED